MTRRVWAEHPIDHSTHAGAWLEFWSWREPRRRGILRRRTEWRWAIGNVLTRYGDAWYRECYEHGSDWGWAPTEAEAVAAIDAAVHRHRYGRTVEPWEGGEVR